MKPITTIILITAIIIFGGVVYADTMTPKELFTQANGYYTAGEYDKAIATYDKILAEGRESGSIYYNLGNSYFRKGNTGKAILNYERAKMIIPRDADLKANYKFARANVQGRLFAQKGLWAWRPLRVYSENFTVNELTWLSSGMFFLLIVLFAVSIFRPVLRRHIVPVCVCLAVAVIVNSVIVWHAANSAGKSAVVTAKQTDAYYGPFDSATKFFSLNEGMNVSILKCKNGWCKVRRGDGKIGWVHGDAVEGVLGNN